ncbi:MAG TPA: Uma2 family endonuclease [Phycisphaerae bacterium]|nr:Uma2 family endonuclease [Phycisphaerae bacterium]
MIRASTTPARLHFSRADYHRMAETGIIPPDARVELLDGEIIHMSPIGPRHGAIVDRLSAFFTPRVAGRAICRVQGSIALTETTEPQPDLVLLKHRDDFYASGHPAPHDVLLVIEVAETSIEHDRVNKLRLYAQAGIPEYWVFDLARNVLIVHRNPTGQTYASVQEHDRSARISPQAFPDHVIDLNEILSS